jgi:sortase, srtB family
MKVEKNKNNTGKKIINIILLIIILACIGILFKRGYDYYTNIQNKKFIDSISTEVEKEVQNDNPYANKEEIALKKLQKFKEINEDVVAYIEIPGTYVNYPVVQAKDNDFYLTRGLDKEYDIAGSLFLDAINDNKFNDENTIIYGHHLEIDSMFTVLDGYRKQDFANAHKTLYLTTEDGLREYRIFSAYGTPQSYNYRTINFAYPEDKIEYFNEKKNKSEVDMGDTEFTTLDSFLTLSTCQYDYNDQRLAVHAVRVN